MLGEERKEHTITDWEIQFQLDPNFEIIRFPEGLVRELGYESLEKLFYFAGTSLLFSLTSEDIPSFRRFLDHAAENSREHCIVRLRTQEGFPLWYLFHDCRFQQEGSQRTAICGCSSLEDVRLLRELSGQKRAQFASRPGTGAAAAEEELPGISHQGESGLPNGSMEQFVDTLPCGMLICEYWTESRRIQVHFFNDTFTRMTGCSTGELRAFRNHQIFSELVAEQSCREFEEGIRRMCASRRDMRCEVRLKRPQAVQWVRVEASVSATGRDSVLLKFALSDISREKKSEEQISFQNYFLARLNETLFFGVIVKKLGLDARPLYLSENISALLRKLVPDAVPGGVIPYSRIIHPADYPAVRELARQCEQERPRNYELEFRLCREDGGYQWIKLMGRRLDDFGSDQTYLLTFFDISSTKSAQEQLRIQEEAYRIAVLHSNDIIVRLNLEEGTIYVPEEVARRYRMPGKVEHMPEVLIRNGCIQPESVEAYLDFYAQIRRGEDAQVEIRSRWFGEKVYWFRGVATVIRDEKQQPVSAILSFTDISSQKQLASEMKTLEESERMLEMIVGSSQKMILKYQFDTDLLLPLSPPAREVLDRISGPHSLSGLVSDRYLAAESLGQAREFVTALRAGVPQNSVNIRVRTADGRWRWYNCLSLTTFSPEQEPVYALLFCEDVTDRRRQELASLRLKDYTSKEHRRILFNLEYNLTLDTFEGSEGVIPDCYQTEFTRSFTASARRIQEDILAGYQEAFREVFTREHLIAAADHGEQSGTLELQIRYQDEPVWVRIFHQTVRDPYTSSVNIWISCVDIHAEKQAELRLTEMAKLDQLTRICNRAAFEEYVTERCAMDQDGLNRALIMLDLDGFGRVNDLLGHSAGDQLLRDIADTLQLTIGEHDMAARIGGDEFAVYSSDFTDIAKARERLRIMVSAMHRELQPGVSISVSAGAAVYPRDGKTFAELYRKADLALYHAKKTGRNRYVIYDDTMAEMPPDAMPAPAEAPVQTGSGIYIRTFGFFEVFIDGEALLIQNAKAKELLALLVDRRGAFVSQGDIISCLWENEPVSKVTLARLRKTAMLLRNALREHGVEDLLESRKGLRRVNTKKARCDLWDYLSHRPEYQHLYRGTYMANYSWGELTIDELEH